MDFEELLNQGRTPSEDGIPETLWDDLAGAHNDAVSTRDAAYNEQGAALVAKDEELATMAALLQKVQAHNYELMMSLEGDPVDEESPESESTPDESAAVDSIWEVKED